MNSTIYDAASTMFQRAHASMTTDELESLAQLTEQATDEARRLSSVCEGLACLVSEDANGKSGAGSFRDEEGFFNLMCVIAQALDTIAAMTHIGDNATYQANLRRLTKPEASSPTA